MVKNIAIMRLVVIKNSKIQYRFRNIIKFMFIDNNYTLVPNNLSFLGRRADGGCGLVLEVTLSTEPR